MRGLATLASSPTEERISEWDIPWGTRLTSAGQTINQNTAYTLSGVWACETIIADAIATLPVDTFRKKGGVSEEVTPPRWLSTPNPENPNRIDYETQRILSLLGWGNAYSILVRQNGTADPLDPVIERWLLNPANVWVNRTRAWDERSPLIYVVHGREVDPGNIQHVRGYTPPGHFLGMSVIQQAARSMGMASAAEDLGESLFKNGINASGVLTVPTMPAEATSAVVDRLRESFSRRYAGPQNANKPIVLTGGTTWSQTMLSPADAQFLETRKWQLNEICRWFRVPGHKVQDIIAHASQGGGQGLEQQAGEFAQDTLLPWIVRLEEADTALIPRGQFVKFNLNAYVRADILTRHQVYQIRRNIGMNNADELRALEDEQPIGSDAGSVYWMPKNMGDAAEPDAAADVTEPPVDPGMNMPQMPADTGSQPNA